MLEMIVNPTPAPQPVTFNYEELKENLTNALADYDKVFTEDDIQEAKTKKAELNKLKKTLNDERIRREKEYMKSFDTFKGQVKELCQLIDDTSNKIGIQLDAFEEKRVRERKLFIEAEFSTVRMVGFNDLDWLTVDRISDEQWLNKSFTETKISGAIKDRLTAISEDMNTLRSMNDDMAVELYKKSLNINEAIKECQNIRAMQQRAEEAKAQQEQQKQVTIEEIKPEPISEPQPEIKTEKKPTQKWVNFRAFISAEQAKQLNEFCFKNKIKIEPIQEV